MFNLYQDFGGTSVPSGWTESGAGISINNGITTLVYATGTPSWITTAPTYGLASNQVTEFSGKYSAANPNDCSLDSGYVSHSTNDCSDGLIVGWNSACTSSVSDFSYNTNYNCGTLAASLAAYHVFYQYWPSSSGAYYSYDYGAAAEITAQVPTSQTYIGVWVSGTGNSAMYVHWFRVRAYPPSGTIPSSAFGSVMTTGAPTTTTMATTTTTAATTTVQTTTNPTTTTMATTTSTTSVPTVSTTIAPLSIPTAPVPSASKLDVGQLVTFTTYVANGIPPYTYNFIISTIGGAIVAVGGPQLSNSLSYPIASAGSLHANVIITDNEVTPVTKNSAYSTTFTVSAAPAANSLTPSSNSITLGQGVTFNVLIAGGTGPFTLKLTASNGVSVNTVVSGAGTVTFGTVFPQFSPSIYNVVATDTGTTSPFAFSSGQSSVAVSNAPTSTSTTVATTTSTSSTSSSSAASTSAATTTASQQGGNGGNNPGGSPGGGGSLPTMIQNGNCYTISNYSQKDTETFTLNGILLSSVVNFIGPTDAGVTVNGRIYGSIVLGANYTILNSTNYTYSMRLLNISYLPVEDTIALGFCSSPHENASQSLNKTLIFNANGNVTDTRISSDPITTPSFGFWPGNLSITNNLTSNAPIYVNVSRLSVPLPRLPAGYGYAVAMNITVRKHNLTNNTVYATLGYGCAINASRIAPFILANGTWRLITPFTTNRELCTVTFGIPADPIVALLVENQTPTSISTSTVPSTAQGHLGSGGAATADMVGLGIALALMVSVAIWWQRKRVKGAGGTTARHPPKQDGPNGSPADQDRPLEVFGHTNEKG